MYIEEHIKTKIDKTYDIVICGGGFAGISAALAASRQGKKVLLLEKQFMLGGLGTAGIVTIFLPICDGLGRQVSFGIAEELLRLSVSMGAEAKYPDNWLFDNGSRTKSDKRFEVQYNPQIFAILAEKLLIDNDVDILYGTYAVGVNVVDNKIEHIIVENKSGRLAFGVSSVVDATGDCDIAHFADVPTEIFTQGNVLAAWYYSIGKKGYQLNMIGCSDIPDQEKTANNTVIHLIERRFTGLDGRELSEQAVLSHASTFDDFIKRRKDDSELLPVTIATTPQIRMTRKILGEYVLSEKEEHTFFEDSIGMVSNWKKRGPVYEVPFRTLYNKKIKNLICAGRCTSVTETMWDVMRVIPCCVVTGQAAGTAAALSTDFATLDIKELQAVLQKNGVVLHEKDLEENGYEL